MAYTGICAFENGALERATVLGLMSAAVWLVGLVVGVCALVAGHLAVAGVSVLVALVAPWLGLAWNLHARLRADDVVQPFAGRVPVTAG